jgi:hypothetical protein
MRQLMATKANGGSQADTVRVLQEWAQANNLSDLTDQQIQDAWVAQAQALGQDLVVKLRSSEQMAHVFAPKDVKDSSGSGSDSSTSPSKWRFATRCDRLHPIKLTQLKQEIRQTLKHSRIHQRSLKMQMSLVAA